MVFIFSLQCSNRKRTSGLINHESFHRGLFFGETDMRGGLGGWLDVVGGWVVVVGGLQHSAVKGETTI